jgi:hypothetical protein
MSEAQPIAEIYQKIIKLVGTNHILPISKNKGLPGIFLERLLGIPNGPNLLDCPDGEIKLFPVKKIKNGTFVPKETIAITMLSSVALGNEEFKASKCYKKMSRMVLVPYYRDGDNITFMNPKLFDSECDEFGDLYSIIESDYNQIRNEYIEKGILKSNTGTLLQNRTKGGRGSKSRAFYLRQEFMKRYIQLSF